MRPVCSDAFGKANAKCLHAMFTMRFIELLHFGTRSCYSTWTPWPILDTPEAVPNTIGHASSHHKAYQSAFVWNLGSERQSQHKGSNEQGTTAKPDLIKTYHQRHIKYIQIYEYIQIMNSYEFYSSLPPGYVAAFRDSFVHTSRLKSGWAHCCHSIPAKWAVSIFVLTSQQAHLCPCPCIARGG